jgi:hypothetical protein
MIDTTTVVATWNAGGGEEVGPSDADVVKLLTKVFQPDKPKAKWSTKIFMGQEFQEKHDRLFLKELGLEHYRYGPECVVAWHPDFWKALSKDDLRLNPNNPFFRPSSDKKVFCDVPAVVLGNELGLTVDTISFHLPSSVQQPDPPDNRVDASQEAAETLRDRRKSTLTHAKIYSGDTNIDPNGPHVPPGVLSQRKTGLKLLVSPRNTLGRRKVDHHLVYGLTDLGGRTLNGPTHHNVHLRRLAFKAA